MTLITLTLLGVLPAALMVLAGRRVWQTSPAGTANQRFLLFLMAAAAALLLVVVVVGLIPYGQTSGLNFNVVMPLVPTLLGLLALILIRLPALREMPSREKKWAGLLALGLVALLAGVWGQPSGLGPVILPGALLLAVAWGLGNISNGAVIILTLISAAQMALINWDWLSQWVLRAPVWYVAPFAIVFYTFPGLAVVTAALGVRGALRDTPRPPAPVAEAGGPSPASPPSLWRRGLRLLLAAALLGGVAYTIYWAALWDQTNDGLSGIWFALQGGVVAIGTGMFLGVTSTGWRRAVGLGFGILAPLVIFGASQPPSQIYQVYTEEHATRIQHAVERFHLRTGRYPATLGELAPRELLWVPGPVNLQGEGWCYQGDANYYRLGTYYREAYSQPLSFRLYASAGTPPAAPWACADRLAELKARHDPPPFSQNPDIRPTPAP